MKNLTDEIKLTIEMMQCDIDDGAHGELQSHLYSLLEMKRDILGERTHTNKPTHIQGLWVIDADDRIDVIGQNGNDGEHYREALIGKRAGGGIIIGFDGDDAIIMSERDIGRMTWGDAITVCNFIEYNGYDDWFLPYKVHLNLAWLNREKLSNLGMSQDVYWSAAEYSTNYACVQYFDNGDQNETDKVTSYRVRPVRSVKIENLEFEGSDIMGDV